MQIGYKIKTKRRKLGITQADLSKKLSISPSYLNLMESGKRKINLDLLLKIANELKKIKFGKTKSYGDIAKKFKISPRHVGKICGQNKILLAIPCHRVIRSDGSLGGFTARGGIKLKKKLLSFES